MDINKQKNIADVKKMFKHLMVLKSIKERRFSIVNHSSFVLVAEC